MRSGGTVNGSLKRGTTGRSRQPVAVVYFAASLGLFFFCFATAWSLGMSDSAGYNTEKTLRKMESLLMVLQPIAVVAFSKLKLAELAARVALSVIAACGWSRFIGWVATKLFSKLKCTSGDL